MKHYVFSFVLIEISMALQEALAFKKEENKTVHFFFTDRILYLNVKEDFIVCAGQTNIGYKR
jgi:hypothetical protein